jgi:Asp-tRNA(Asn)/Glu-tRNA(Gln) amidotransferase A subunit family amidase
MRSVIAVLALCAWLSGTVRTQDTAPFHLEEATVASIHAAFAAGRLTCVQLTRAYLDRIEAYDRQGPALRSIITVNPAAMEIAADKDRQYRTNRASTGPLHCIPIVLKDNFNTADMPTTGGNVSMRTSQPPADAFTVARIRAAGALILAKANLQEFARGGMSVSSLGGQVLNPYDLTRTPGGSSGGTGAAVAANLAVMGTGTDTGQSIRSPASANSLVGVRPTRGLVSRAGIIPNSQIQDEAGPIARTVTDAARLLDVMAGFDEADPITGLGQSRRPRSYADGLNAGALKGARIGVMTNLSGREERHREVNAVLDAVMKQLTTLGATLIPFELAAYDTLAPSAVTAQFEARTVMERYFASLPPSAPIRSFADLIAAKSSAVQKTLESEFAIANGMATAQYQERLKNRDRLRAVVTGTMTELKLDAILYPLQKILVAPITANDQEERNGALSHATGFPAVTFPGGFSAPTAQAPIGVPIGAELLGLDYSEPKLLAYAYAFEQAARVRKPPTSTPPLKNEP